MNGEEDAQIQEYISTKISDTNSYQTTLNNQLAEEKDELDALILAKIEEILKLIMYLNYKIKINFY